MKTFRNIRPDLDDHGYGSRFDPVLNGVARGLGHLFPPIEADRPDQRRDARPEPAASQPDRTETSDRS